MARTHLLGTRRGINRRRLAALVCGVTVALISCGSDADSTSADDPATAGAAAAVTVVADTEVTTPLTPLTIADEDTPIAPETTSLTGDGLRPAAGDVVPFTLEGARRAPSRRAVPRVPP